MDKTTLISIGVVVAATAVAAVVDIRRFKVYNVLTLPLLATGLVFHAVTGGWSGFGDGMAGAAFGFFSLLGFYAVGGMGSGDVKLMAGVGAWLGLTLTFQVFLAASLAAGAYAIVLLVLNRGIAETLVYIQLTFERFLSIGRRFGADSHIEEEVVRDDRRGRLIPFAAMIFLGLCVSLLRIRYLAG